MADIFTPPDILAEMPVDVSINTWTTRLKAEETLSVNRSLGFEFTDLDETYGLTIRRGVCQFDANPDRDMDIGPVNDKARIQRGGFRQHHH